MKYSAQFEIEAPEGIDAPTSLMDVVAIVAKHDPTTLGTLTGFGPAEEDVEEEEAPSHPGTGIGGTFIDDDGDQCLLCSYPSGNYGFNQLGVGLWYSQCGTFATPAEAVACALERGWALVRTTEGAHDIPWPGRYYDARDEDPEFFLGGLPYIIGVRE